MLKKTIMMLALLQAESCFSLTTLPDTWPLEAESLPITVDRMDQFKNDCLAYMAGINANKPLIYPDVDSWVDWHTNLFRIYAVSLETLLVNFVQTFDGTTEYNYGNCLVNLFNAIDAVSAQEVMDSAVSVSVLADSISSMESDNSTAQSVMQQRVLDWVNASLVVGNGGTPSQDPSSIDSDVQGQITNLVTAQSAIDNQNFLSSTASTQGITTDWAQAQIDAQNGLLDSDEVSLNNAITSNIFDQNVIITQLDNNSLALATVAALASDPNAAYDPSVYAALTSTLNDQSVALAAALTQKRIDMDEGLLGGTYNPSDYTNQSPSTYVPPQVKFVSMPAFKSCWDAAAAADSLDYVTAQQSDLDNRDLTLGVMAII